jgi:ATP-binding cassette subfamily B protein
MTDQTSASLDPRGRTNPGAALVAQIAEGKAKRAKSRDVRPLGRLRPFLAAHKLTAAMAIVFMVLSTSMTLSLSVAARLVIDHGFTPDDIEIWRAGGLTGLLRVDADPGHVTGSLTPYFGILLVIAVLLASFTALRVYFVNRIGERVVADLRKQVYAHVLTLDQTFFLNTRTGEVLSRMTTDIAIVEGVVGTSASVALRNILLVLGGIVLLFFVNPFLTLCVLLVVPAVLLPLLLFGRRVRRLSANAQDRFADAIGYAGESLDQLETVQAFGREKTAAARFDLSVESAFSAALQRIQSRALLSLFVMLFVFCGIAAVLWLGVDAVRGGHMTGGALLQFVILSVLAASAVSALGEVWGDVQKAAGAMERISEVLAAKPTIAAPAHPVALPEPPRGEIVFDDVRFHYPSRDDLPALNGFSLHVAPGEVVALVGPSGAGKSTVLRLLLRFYDPQSGSISLDGVDLRDADPVEARARLALVAQDASLFSTSALENIRFGREDASEAEVRAAARAAEAEGFIDALPEGFSGALGERGRTLSGGQRQRLAIARALVRNAPVLLLDEATSALDAENERLVQQALYDAMQGRTTLIIAHRLATVLRADRIVVVDNGRVVEQGRHAELVAQGGLYAKLARLQFDTHEA